MNFWRTFLHALLFFQLSLSDAGVGRICTLHEKISITDAVTKIKNHLSLPSLRLALKAKGHLSDKVRQLLLLVIICYLIYHNIFMAFFVRETLACFALCLVKSLNTKMTKNRYFSTKAALKVSASLHTKIL